MDGHCDCHGIKCVPPDPNHLHAYRSASVAGAKRWREGPSSRGSCLIGGGPKSLKQLASGSKAPPRVCLRPLGCWHARWLVGVLARWQGLDLALVEVHVHGSAIDVGHGRRKKSQLGRSTSVEPGVEVCVPSLVVESYAAELANLLIGCVRRPI